MANQAYLVSEEGGKIRVYAESLTEQDRGKKYQCSGIIQYGTHRDEECGAEMMIRREETGKYCFVVMPSSKHRAGCEYDEASCVKQIAHRDHVCKDSTLEGLLEEMWTTRSVQKKACPKGTEEERNLTEEREEDTEENPKDIKRVAKHPQNADELYMILTSKQSDDYFAGKLVRDAICYKNTFDYHFNHGIDDAAVLVVLKKYPPRQIPDALEDYKSGYYIFACKEGNREMFFATPKDNSGIYNGIFEPDTHSFAIFAKWKRISSDKPYYYCEKELIRKQISLLPNKE